MPNLFCLLVYMFLICYCNSVQRKTCKPGIKSDYYYSIKSFKEYVLNFLNSWYNSDSCQVGMSSLSKINHFKLFLYDLRSNLPTMNEFETELAEGFIKSLSDIDKLPKM